MSSVPEFGEQFATHPGALEAAAAMRSEARGVRPQWEDRLPIPTRPFAFRRTMRGLAASLLTVRPSLPRVGSASSWPSRAFCLSFPHRGAARSLLAMPSIWSMSTTPRQAGIMS